MSAQGRVAVDESSRVGEARRLAVAMAADLGMSQEERSDVAIVVTEAATNLLRHATDGELLLQPCPGNGGLGLEALFLDRGPGMRDVERCSTDGYSSAGTQGAGLGAMRRLSQFMDVYSEPGRGTAVVCRFWSRAARPSELHGRTGGLAVPIRGERDCGDAWTTWGDAERTVVLVADGLGHGSAAAAASSEAVRLAHANERFGPGPLLELLHAGLRGTRGAAIAIAEVRAPRREVVYAGIGNIAGVVTSAEGESRSLLSYAGIVGHQARRIHEIVLPMADGATLVMHSDGLHGRWSLADHPGLCRHDPTLAAGVLYRDASRGRDDACVVVHRPEERSS